mgnify:CR=1 FL=1
MKTDILEEFILRINSSIGESRRIIENNYLIENIDCIRSPYGRISVYPGYYYFYTQKYRYQLDWNDDFLSIVIGDFLNSSNKQTYFQ